MEVLCNTDGVREANLLLDGMRGLNFCFFIKNHDIDMTMVKCQTNTMHLLALCKAFHTAQKLLLDWFVKWFFC